jgi:hypothetical protein
MIMGLKCIAKSLAPVLLVTAILSCSGSGPTEPTYRGYCNHLPLEVGNKWVYAGNVTDEQDASDASELKLEVFSHLGVFEGFDSWLVAKSDDGEVNARIYAGCDGDRCYLGDQKGTWRFLIGDKMPPDCTTETGLLTSARMSYSGGHYIEVPAGKFEDSKLLYAHHHSESGIPLVAWTVRDDEYWEYFAPGVGLVYYRHYWKVVEWVFMFPRTVDEGNAVFELTSYKVHRGPS